MKNLLLFLFGSVGVWLPTVGYACPPGQYEQCVGPSIHTPFLNVDPACACVPNGATVVQGVNPLPDTLNILGSAVKGDVHGITQGVGGLVIKSSCLGCAVAAQTILSHDDKAFAEMVVGRGWLVFLSTGSPSLVLVDAATSAPRQYALTHPQPNPLAPKPAPTSTSSLKAYKVSGALCALQDEKHYVAAGWVDPPTLSDASGKTYIFPNVDLTDGVEITIQALNAECIKAPEGQTYVTNTTIKYDYSSVPPTGTPTAMKFFLFGQKL